MVHAYSYRIEYSNQCHRIYLNENLFATITRREKKIWHLQIKSNNDYYRFTKSGFLKSFFCIENLNVDEVIGTIHVPLVPFFLPKYRFIKESGVKMYWLFRNFFSFHWLWKQGNEVIAEAVEDMGERGSNGVIKLSVYDNESNFLIITGIFLSIRRKQRLLPRLHKDSKNVW